MNNLSFQEKMRWIAIGILIVIVLRPEKKEKHPYHSEIYSSWEEEQLDEMRADLNYLEEKLEKSKY